jgi:hypothetical protein
MIAAALGQITDVAQDTALKAAARGNKHSREMAKQDVGQLSTSR